MAELLPAEAGTMQESLNLGRSSRSFAGGMFDDEEDTTEGANRSHSMNGSTYGGIPAMVKLPPLNIEPFAGSLIDWPEFRAKCLTTFTKIVDEVHRFIYFKGYLTGEPARMVKHLPMVVGSYDKAFEILKKRYDNPRAIVNANLNRLFELDRFQNESAQDLNVNS